MNEFTVVATRRIHSGRVFALRQDEVRLPDGSHTTLDIIEHGGATVILPLDGEGRLWFVRQYRHAIGQTLLELPAGTLQRGEAPDACAAREIREEIGMAAGKLERLGAFYIAPGYSSEHLHIYLATTLTPDKAEHDADEVLEAVALPLAEAFRRADAGEMEDGKTLAALLLLRARLARGAP